MSAETWGIISLCGFVLAGLLFIASVILFIVLRISSVIGDLSGRTVAREMAKLRENNAARGERKYRTGRVNRERGPLTEKVSTGKIGKTGKVGEKKSKGNNARASVPHGTDAIGAKFLPPEGTTSYLGTEKLAEEALVASGGRAAGDTVPLEDAAELLRGEEKTELLRDDATEVLRDDNATEVLRDVNATEVLQDADAAKAQRDEGTVVLSQRGVTAELAKKKAVLMFRKTKDIVVTHDKETERN